MIEHDEEWHLHEAFKAMQVEMPHTAIFHLQETIKLLKGGHHV